MKYLDSSPVLPFGALVVIMSDQIFFFFEEVFINKSVLCGPDTRRLKLQSYAHLPGMSPV